MKILSFGASTSSKSINRQLALYAANQVRGAELTDLDLRTFSLPIYSSDEEEANGIPSDAQRFFDLIREHDAVVISLAEHNGSYAAAFKNLFDWATRIDQKIWANKPMLLLATSPGGRGGSTVLEAAKTTFPHLGGDIRGGFSLPSFYDSFDPELGIKDKALADALSEIVSNLSA
ncbi:MAG: NAD(P)H-dependent oxidoreductase [Verrucomicrobia bacterium]|jgi:chromate reductase, NAD(P)H dehydrogenase (quinone)|nr:NAD(P)H-dependent oxidoreductase [Verrucomicrobiota bacterium]MDA7645046.1 NAD(P)H-dependent oxidoreductase [bacterium]MDA7667767.1 NAD(P)H-dependent oxidoreductase [bacterium]MDB4745678.1 NAD(P)H-dependent oxidoreductase [Verrucomicrobiota bacterium]